MTWRCLCFLFFGWDKYYNLHENKKLRHTDRQIGVQRHSNYFIKKDLQVHRLHGGCESFDTGSSGGSRILMTLLLEPLFTQLQY